MRLQFDRGTLVLAAGISNRLDAIPCMRWDARIGAYRAPAFQYRALCEEFRLRGLGSLEFGKRATVLQTRDVNADWLPVDLRAYQQAAVLAWDRDQRGLIVLPTGSGKTRVACAVMSACGVRALCLVPTRALMHQWSDEIAKYYRGPIGCLGDGQHRLEAITVSTFESAYRGMARFGDHFGLIVVDEVHHFGIGVRDEALEMCAAPRRLALTATTLEGEALMRVNELMGPIVCELRVADLAGLWLADFENIVLGLRLTPDEQKQYDYLCRTFRAVFERFRAFNPTGTWRDFTVFAFQSESGRSALAAFRASRQITSYSEAKRHALATLLKEHHDQRVLVFTSDNAAAYAIAREHLIMPMTCDIARAEREQALAAFRSGELRALVSGQVLNEGIDVPDAEVAIIVGGVRGAREHVQRVGRLLRPVPKKRACVYELVIEGTHEVRKSAVRRRALDQVGGRRA